MGREWSGCEREAGEANTGRRMRVGGGNGGKEGNEGGAAARYSGLSAPFFMHRRRGSTDYFVFQRNCKHRR